VEQMAMVANTHLLTVAEFEEIIALPENRDKLLELVNGEIVEKVPTEEHGEIIFILAGELYIYLRQNPEIGRGGVEVRHHLPGDEHNARLPDLSLRLDVERETVKEGAVAVLPAFVAEVKSPDDSAESLRERAEYYLRNGSQLVWLMFPKNKTVEACKLVNGRLHIEVFRTDDVLDGFTLPVKRLFEK
jgi:Uma2 family endonuclease